MKRAFLLWRKQSFLRKFVSSMKTNKEFLQFKQFQYRVLSTLTFKYEKIVNYETFKRFSQWKNLSREQDHLNRSQISMNKVNFEVSLIDGFIDILSHLP